MATSKLSRKSSVFSILTFYIGYKSRITFELRTEFRENSRIIADYYQDFKTRNISAIYECAGFYNSMRMGCYYTYYLFPYQLRFPDSLLQSVQLYQNILMLLCAIPAMTRNSRLIVFQCHMSYFKCHIRNAPFPSASTLTL